MSKRDYHHGNLKEELFSIAFEHIERNDAETLTLKVLADATGTSRSAIYRHFANKDALMEAVILRGFDLFDTTVSTLLNERERSLVDRFYLATREYIEYARDHPNLYRLLFGKKYAYIRESVMSLKDPECLGFGPLKAAIEEGQQAGVVRKDDSYEQALVILASVHGLAMMVIDGFQEVDDIYETLYQRMFESLLAGIVSDRAKLISTIPFVKNLLKPVSAVRS
jgi:AcrR family transcriptional regulator